MNKIKIYKWQIRLMWSGIVVCLFMAFFSVYYAYYMGILAAIFFGTYCLFQIKRYNKKLRELNEGME